MKTRLISPLILITLMLYGCTSSGNSYETNDRQDQDVQATIDQRVQLTLDAQSADYAVTGTKEGQDQGVQATIDQSVQLTLDAHSAGYAATETKDKQDQDIQATIDQSVQLTLDAQSLTNTPSETATETPIAGQQTWMTDSGDCGAKKLHIDVVFTNNTSKPVRTL